jgi:U4/U6.U5 tri-snRNP-associated protein 1
LDEEGDELISTALEEKQKLEENIRNKKGLRKHSDQDEDGKTSILNRDDNDDEKDDFFLLDGAEALPSKATELKTPVPKSVMTRTSLNFEDDMDLVISSDYQEAKPAKFKKPKKRKATAQAPQARKRIRDDDEVVVSNGDIENIDDDVDLQAMLALNRRKVQKTRRLLTPEEIAEQMQKDKEEEDRTKPKEGIVISSTNDFLASVKQARLRLSTEPEEDEVEKAGMELQPVSATEEKAKVENAEAILVAQEPSISGGMGDALRLLQSRGMVKKKTVEELELERQKQEQRDWTTKMRKERLLRELDIQRQREQDRLSGKYDTLSLKEREQVAVRENRERDLLEAREAQKRFENYRPQVNLEYRDELGRKLNEREAYKHLSHQFHGKGPGKGKIDKQLKQMAEESKSEAVSIFDAGVNNDVENRKKAGIRLQ